MANVTLRDVYDGLWARVSAMPGYKTVSLKWNDYVAAKQGRPALFMRQTMLQALNEPVGMPARYQLTFEICVKLDIKGDPNQIADYLLLEAQDKLLQALAPEQTNARGDECCHLDLGKGWVMHAWLSSTEFFTALQDQDDQLSAIFTVDVLCAARLASP